MYFCFQRKPRTTLQVEQKWGIVICMEIPGILISPLLCCNATWLFLWFYQKLIHFQSEKSKNAKKKVVLPRNPSSRVFLFQAVIVFFPPIMTHCYIKIRPNAPNCQQHRTPGMPCLVECLWQRSSGYLLPK